MLMEMISVSEFLQPLEIMVFLVALDLYRPPARHRELRRGGRAWIAGAPRMFLFKNQGTGFSTGQ